MDQQMQSIMHDRDNPGNTLDLMEYWRVIDRAKWRIIMFTFVVAVISIFYSLSLTPQYTSTLTLMIDTERANTVSIREIYDVNDNNRTYYQTQYQVLQSRQLAEKVIEELDLLSKADFDSIIPNVSAEKGVSTESMISFLSTGVSDGDGLTEAEVKSIVIQNAVEMFQEKLSFDPIINTQLVRISFDSADPQLAADIVNGLAEIYIRSFLESKLEMEAKASAWMNERLTTIKDKLEVAEANLQAFLEREGLVDVSGISSLAQRELDQLSTQLTTARTRVSQSKSIFDLTTGSNRTVDQLLTVPEVLNHPVVRQVKNAEIQVNQRITELSQRYGPRHLSMIAAKSRIGYSPGNIGR